MMNNREHPYSNGIFRFRINHAKRVHDYEIARINHLEKFGNIQVHDEPVRARQILMEIALLNMETIAIDIKELAELIKSIEEY